MMRVCINLMIWLLLLVVLFTLATLIGIVIAASYGASISMVKSPCLKRIWALPTVQRSVPMSVFYMSTKASSGVFGFTTQMIAVALAINACFTNIMTSVQTACAAIARVTCLLLVMAPVVSICSRQRVMLFAKSNSWASSPPMSLLVVSMAAVCM